MAKSGGITLTDVTFMGRQGVKLGAIALVTLMVGRMLWGAFITYWKATHPPAPPPPTMGFGSLPQLRFPEQASEDRPTSISLETPQGTLPNFGDRAKVFLMPKATLGLFADQDARKIAAAYDFIFEPEVLSTRLYRWKKSQPLESTLQLDIQTHQLRFTTNYLSRSDLLKSQKQVNASEAIGIVKGFLERGNLMPPDMATASGEVSYLKVLGTELVPAVSQSDADLVQVDLNRVPVDNQYRMYTPNGKQGAVRAIVGGNFSAHENVYQLLYNYHPVDSFQVETYPLRPTNEAWAILQSGEGYVAEKGKNDQATVRRVYLGYYDDFEEQDYLQPIYVFEGDDGFLGYVSALSPQVLQSEGQGL